MLSVIEENFFSFAILLEGRGRGVVFEMDTELAHSFYDIHTEINNQASRIT